MKHVLLAALLFGAASSAVAIPRPPATLPSGVTYCPAVVYQDYQFGVVYYAQVYRAGSCQAQDLTRVRKTSTLNTRANGAQYQPIRPGAGAWEVTPSGDTIPNDAQWTLYSWDWEYYDGLRWQKAVVK